MTNASRASEVGLVVRAGELVGDPAVVQRLGELDVEQRVDEFEHAVAELEQVPLGESDGVRIRMPFTSVPFVLARSLIVTLSSVTRITSAWMPLTARSRTRMSHSGRRPMICRPRRSRKTCPGRSPSSMISAGSVVCARLTASVVTPKSRRTSVVFLGMCLSESDRNALLMRSIMDVHRKVYLDSSVMSLTPRPGGPASAGQRRPRGNRPAEAGPPKAIVGGSGADVCN